MREREARHHPQAPSRTSYVAECLAGADPVVATSDYVRALPQMIASYVAAPFTALGTDGFGRSDSRAALRNFFEVDSRFIVLATLYALMRDKQIEAAVVEQAIKDLRIETEKPNPAIS